MFNYSVRINASVEKASFFESTFGIISPKISITTVTRIVAIVDASATLSLKRFITISVVQVEIAILARLLPISIAESEVVNLSQILNAILAVQLPHSQALRSRILFAVLKAISEAEK